MARENVRDLAASARPTRIDAVGADARRYLDGMCM